LRVLRYSSVVSLAKADRAHGLGANECRREIHHFLDHRKRRALLAQPIVRRDLHAVEAHVCSANLVDGAIGLHRNALRLRIDQVEAGSFRRPNGNDELVRLRAMQDHALVAMKHAVALLDCHGREVVSAASLRVRERKLHLALHHRREDRLSLSGSAGEGDEARADADGGEVGLDHERVTDRLHRAHHVHRTAAEATVVGRHGKPEKAEIRQRGPHLRAVPLG
jgi:hypothetical protein